MNDEAKDLNLKKSHFTVAHGMHHDQNYSTAYDIGKLCCLMMKNPKFKSVVSQQTLEVGSLTRSLNDAFLLFQQDLLKEGYSGIKTGITPTAGPCLAASVNHSGYNVCVVILSSCSMDSRWYEVPKLVAWGVKKIIRIQTSKLRPKVKRKIMKSITYI